MQDLLTWTRETLDDNSYHPLIVTAAFNVVFLAIHPFQDGNGRLSRVLVSLLLLKTGYSYIPYASLESIVEKSKDAYYLSLQRTQRTLHDQVIDWTPWLRFLLNVLKRQKDHLIEKTRMLGGYTELPFESMLIMQYVDSHHRITIGDAEKIITTIARPTIKNRCWSARRRCAGSSACRRRGLGSAALNGRLERVGQLPGAHTAQGAWHMHS